MLMIYSLVKPLILKFNFTPSQKQKRILQNNNEISTEKYIDIIASVYNKFNVRMNLSLTIP